MAAHDQLAVSSLARAEAPRVSVGMPVYNAERYLAGTLDTILAQSFRDFELIISDNGSTDRTARICRNYASHDTRIRYVRHEVNRGAAWNHNYVLSLARGNSSNGIPTTTALLRPSWKNVWPFWIGPPRRFFAFQNM